MKRVLMALTIVLLLVILVPILLPLLAAIALLVFGAAVTADVVTSDPPAPAPVYSESYERSSDTTWDRAAEDVATDPDYDLAGYRTAWEDCTGGDVPTSTASYDASGYGGYEAGAQHCAEWQAFNVP